MAAVLKKLVTSKLLASSVLSCRPLAARCFKSISFDEHPYEKSRIIEVDCAGNRKSMGKSLITAVYSFTDVICPLSPSKKLENILNMMDTGEDGRATARWQVKESADAFSMVRHITQTKPDVTAYLDMDGAPKDLGYKLGVGMFGDIRIWRVLQNPSTTLLIQRKPHVELESDDHFLVTVQLPAGLFHTNDTTIETTECGDLKITLKKLKAMRILSLLCSVHKRN